MTESSSRSIEPWIFDDWNELLYYCAKTQEYLLGAVLNLKYAIETDRHHTLIRSMSTRLKSLDSVKAKLGRLHLEVTPQSASASLHDIIGIRIICSYLDDIPEVVDELRTIDQFEILEIKDYIHHPKPSGYRSLHLIGICTGSGRPVLCEMQLRTTAMDSWAALEHQMRYKKGLPQSDYVNEELLACADLLYASDVKMQNVHVYLKKQGLQVENSDF